MAHWIRDETVIAVKGDDLLSRLHTLHYLVAIVHQSIIKNPLTEADTNYTIRFVLHNVFRLLFMFVTRVTFTKFAHVILIHWCVISIVCKMTHELLASNMQKSMGNVGIWCISHFVGKKSPWIAHRNKMHWFKKSFRFTNWIKNRLNYHINSKIQLNFLIKISNQLNSPMIKFSNQSNFPIKLNFQSKFQLPQSCS